MEGLYLGHDARYWVELQKRAEEFNFTELIEEIAKLRGKVDFYESRIIQMNEARKNK